MNQLELQNISKNYKKKQVLEPLSLTANKGECIVLSGGNGAGKSTLLSIIAGILAPSSGTVSLNGISLESHRRSYVEQIGYMPDDFLADPTMTVREFLLFYASLRKINKKRVEEVLALVGLEEQRNYRITGLSKGMRQRLLFGQAWLGKPALLLLDEPTNGLDPYWVNAFVQHIKAIKNSGTIVIFSTHMMDVAAETADRILFMKAGKVMEQLTELTSKEEVVMELLKLQRVV
ncbi:ABC transporter ATP-binding protein [Bacillus tuaregi]|uniref:ABC transporter ATP-binding protein n=1 Tax=Bacillus tuaregi TaxID=1816695 RepID=UPI0008F95572|nr:ABC transporter ATP-binding protein [Bacillus tuaregi]